MAINPKAKTYPYIVTYGVNADQKARLVAWAAHEGLSMTELMRRLFERYVEEHPIIDGAPEETP